MKPCTTRRVQAQRKFAQGAYAPVVIPSGGGGPEKKPVEQAKEKNIIRNHVPARTLLDMVSFKNIHTHRQPYVKIHRLDNITLDKQKNTEHPHGQPKTIIPNVKERLSRTRKTLARHSWDMTLRSRSEVRKPSKQSTNIRKRKSTEPEVQKTKKKRVCEDTFTPDDNRPLTYFAKPRDKNKTSKTNNITKLAKKVVAKKMNIKNKPKAKTSKNTSENGKKTSPLQVAESKSGQNPSEVLNISEPPALAEPSTALLETGDPCDAAGISRAPTPAVRESPVAVAVFEPQPGPSGLQLNPDVMSHASEVPIELGSENFFPKNDKVFPYYDTSEIRRWITGSSDIRPIAFASPLLDPEKEHVDPPIPTPSCPATTWTTLKEVIDAPTKDLEARCRVCATCNRINNFFMLSMLLKKYRQVECTDEEENGQEQPAGLPKDNAMVSPDGDLYMELLPKHPHFMIKLKIQTIHNKQMLSARLCPRSEALMSKDLSLFEHENIIDQLIKMLRSNLDSTSTFYALPLENYELEHITEESVIDLTQGDKCSVRSEDRSEAGSQPSSFPQSVDGPKQFDAPVFYPTKEEFADPIAYFEKIAPVASKYGLCKVIPPPSHWFAPKCKIDDDIRFDVINQYISRLYNRWGPASRELCAIKACLKTQSLNLTRSPLLDGIEVNLPKLYHVVQSNGGLEKVINKKRWGKVAEEMSFPKTPNPEKKLDSIYVKYLLPYDTLAHKERQEIIRKIERHWNVRNQKLLDRALNPLHRQKRLLGESDSSDEDTGDESEVGNALAEAEDCIVAGSCMNLTKFKRLAAITLANNFRNTTEPSLPLIEERYWRLVLLGNEHVCINTASIDTGEEGYGFSKNRQDPYSEHPWNLKMLSQNSGNVLRSLGPVLGLTVPSLHLGMVFSSSCWHSDPHGLPWMEYMHQGAPKIWYGIPDEQSRNFRKAVETVCPTSCQNKSIWLPSDITMIPPTLLLEHNVSLAKVTQNPGEFVIVYPKAYSCSISTGYTLSESVYFAAYSWLNSVDLVFKELRESCEPTMFSLEQLLLAVLQDERTPLAVLSQARDALAAIVADEKLCRQELLLMGLPMIFEKNRENIANKKRRNTSAWNVRDLDECEVCRMTLYLSKVSGLTGRRSAVCLQHALRLLHMRRRREGHGSELEVVIYVPELELNAVLEQVQRRLVSGAASSSTHDV